MTRKNVVVSIVTGIVLVSTLLAGCGSTATPTATVAPTAAPKATTAPTAVPATATKVPPTNTPAPTPTKAPVVGGTLLWGMSAEPDTLDPHKSVHTMMGQILTYVGATLVTKDASTGNLVPYLAESWTVSPDGLALEFKLRKGVKFHDGSPLTAQEYAWTFNRAIDPATKSTSAAQIGVLSGAAAIDDYTLRLNLKQPSYPLLSNLANPTWCPLPRAQVEKLGDQFGRNPVSVGPFMFKQWVTGSKVVVERNPDYNWMPPSLKGGGPYIQTIEFRFVPDYASATAAIESGEIDYYFSLLAKDVDRLKATGKVDTFESMYQGAYPGVYLNLSKAPISDVRVRKALSLSIDRQAMIKAVLQGQGVEQRGPVSPAVAGYWSGVEKIGYGFDLAQAKTLMKEAGFTANASGVLEKDGQPFKFTLTTRATEDMIKPSEMLQQMWKALGVDVNILQVPSATLVSNFLAGNYDVITMQPTGTDFDTVATFMSSKKVGGVGVTQADDPELDRLLLATRTTMDPDQRQEACNAAQKYIVEQALMITVFAPKTFDLISKRIQGAVFNPFMRSVWLTSAYINSK